MANGQGVRLPAAADPLGRADYLAVAHVGGSWKGGRNQSIFMAAALPAAAFEKELSHLVGEAQSNNSDRDHCAESLSTHHTFRPL